MSKGDWPDDWRVSLGNRHNLLYNNIPYIPVLVEDIPVFLSFKDFKTNGIKTIQTLGEFIPINEKRAALLSLTRGNNSKFPISLKYLKTRNLYVKKPKNTYCAIWEKYIVFKVYGILKKNDFGYTLEITHLVPIHNVIGTWKVMIILITIARTEYRQYRRTEAQNEMLQFQWDKMKKEKKRLVNEIM